VKRTGFRNLFAYTGTIEVVDRGKAEKLNDVLAPEPSLSSISCRSDSIDVFPKIRVVLKQICCILRFCEFGKTLHSIIIGILSAIVMRLGSGRTLPLTHICA